jgi:hypothetical protein
MNTTDLSKFSLGQYGSVFLDNAAELDLLGSTRYVIGAIQFIDATLGPEHLMTCANSAAFSVGDYFGGKNVHTFQAGDVDLSNDTIKVKEGALKIGDTVNFCIPEGGALSGLTAIDADAISSMTYHVVSEERGKVKFSATAGGSVVNITAATAGYTYKISSPAMTAVTEALVRDALDISTDDDVSNVPVWSADAFVDGMVIYGRWNYIKMNSTTCQAIAYLAPK